MLEDLSIENIITTGTETIYKESNVQNKRN